MHSASDTICAVSTPSGFGGIAVIRISGDDSYVIVDGIFQKEKKKTELKDLPSHSVHYGKILEPTSGEWVDEVLLLLLRGPRTYTREDTVEIHCHGGGISVRKILKILVSRGCRLARPGEFTQRAFLNGRIDLVQAEAVMDLISSTNESSSALALRQLEGELSEEIHQIREMILSLLIPIEASLDFPDEDIPIHPRTINTLHRGAVSPDGMGVPPYELLEGASSKVHILRLSDRLSSLIKSYDEGKVYRDGITTAIVGAPNVGKSSLLNRLLGEDRAIVTPYPGTTRDLIEESILVEGIPLCLVDMAGIRKTDDPVEGEGIRRAEAKMQEADLILHIIDASTGIVASDKQLLEQTKVKARIIVLNKMDKGSVLDVQDFNGESMVPISALTGMGIDSLRKEVRKCVEGRFCCDGYPRDGIMIIRSRHREALQLSRTHLMEFLQSEEDGLPMDIQAVHLRSALDSLGEIIGVVTTEGLLNRIFSEFCIGK